MLRVYPELEVYINQLPIIENQKRSEIHPVNAISEVIIGQMLSRDAARSIRTRANDLMQSNGFEFLGELTIEELRSAGLSNGKAKTVSSITEAYSIDPSRIDAWHQLDYEALRKDVSRFWGVSDWTASILALFYFGTEDMFPVNDGSIKRTIDKFAENKIEIDIELASPYKSYLALYLWAILDNGYLD